MARGGKRPGAGRKKGLDAEAYRKYLIDQIVIHKAPLVDALIKKGISGDVQALKEIGDRALGRPQPSVEVKDKEGNSLTITWDK
jgi:hypothetical protein